MGKLKILYQKYTGGVVFFLILFYTIIFALISVWKYINYNYNALDLAIINQVFYNTNLGNLFASSIHPPTYLTDHFELIILLLSPIYRIWPQPLILLILQTITMAISAWPIYLISKKHLNKNWAVLLVLVWLTNPFVQSINLFEFHILPFAIPLILLSFYYFDQEKFWPFLITSAISLLVREDVALVILMFGILAIVQRKKTKWWLWPIVLSVTYFAAVMKINQLIAPDGQYKFFVYYAWLGSSWPEIIKNAIFKPWLIIRHLITLPSFEFIIGLLMPFALLPLLKSEYLILGAAIFAQLVLGASGGSATILQVHYPALLLPSLFIATIFAIKKILAEKNQTKNKVIKLINQDRHLSFIIFLAAFVYSSLTLGPLPGSLTKITQRGWILPETKAKNDLIKQIPSQSPTAGTYEFLTKLSGREKIYSFNYVFLGFQQFLKKEYRLPEDTKYIAIDFQDLLTYQLQYGKNPYYQTTYNQVIQEWANNLNGFGLIYINDTLALYQKGQADKFKLLDILPSRPEIKELRETNLDDKITFIGFNHLADNSYQLFWQANTELTVNYQLKLRLEKNDKIVYQKTYPLAYNILPATLWQKDKIIQTNYWFNFFKKIPAGDYNLKMELIEIKRGGIEVDSFRSTVNAIERMEIVGQNIDLGIINL